jgi:hypothetical protein
MDKMAQWKASILGINKSGHGGPVKGKMPMSAPMAKYASGGKVVKKADGGKVKKRDDGYEIDESVVNRIYGKDSDKLSDVDKNNATVMSKSNKKWRDDEVGYMATNPPGRLRQKPKDYAKGGQVKGLKMGSKKVQKHADEAQDKILFGKMMKKAGVMKKADGGSVKSPEMRDKVQEAQKESQRIMRNAQLKKDYRDAGKESLWNEIEADAKKRSPEMRDKVQEAQKESQRIMRNAQLKKDYRDAGKESLWNEIEADAKKRSLVKKADGGAGEQTRQRSQRHHQRHDQEPRPDEEGRQRKKKDAEGGKNRVQQKRS